MLCKQAHQKILPGLCCAQCTRVDDDDEYQYGISHDSKDPNEDQIENGNDDAEKHKNQLENKDHIIYQANEKDEGSCRIADKTYKVSI